MVGRCDQRNDRRQLVGESWEGGGGRLDQSSRAPPAWQLGQPWRLE